MKQFIIIALCLIIGAFAPHPTPVSKFDLSRINGKWYVHFMRSNLSPKDNRCWTETVQIDGKSVSIIESFYDSNGHISSECTAVVSDHSNATWTIDQNYQGVFMSVDEKNYEWLMLGSTEFSFVYFFSRNLTVSKTVVAEQITLAVRHGYNMIGTFFPNNTDCTPHEIMI